MRQAISQSVNLKYQRRIKSNFFNFLKISYLVEKFKIYQFLKILILSLSEKRKISSQFASEQKCFDRVPTTLKGCSGHSLFLLKLLKVPVWKKISQTRPLLSIALKHQLLSCFVVFAF